MNYARIVTEFRTRAWAVKADTFGSMMELVAKWGRGEKFSEQEVEVRIRDANARNGVNRGGDEIYHEPLMISSGSQRGGSQRGAGDGIVCLIPVIGVISHRSNMLEAISSGGGTSIEKLTGQFRQAISNPGVKAIVLDCDSPGGSVDSVFELAQEIYEARGRKKIIAVANTLAASACYAIAAAASELVVAPSGMVGSIGVFASHEDHSEELAKAGVRISLISAGKYKTEGNTLEPLTDSARADLQDKVNDFYQMFVRCVASFRGDSQANVKAGYGQGRCATAADAIRANLADRMGTLDDVLLRLGVARPGMSAGGAGQKLAASARVIRPSLQRQKMELDLLEMGPARGKKPAALRANPDDDDNFCGCDCEACKACTGTGAGPKADDVSCICGCKACEACENRPGAARLSAQGVRLELDMIELGAPMRRGESLESIHRRRRRELDELLL
jgi:signal peptide peptidase SppA